MCSGKGEGYVGQGLDVADILAVLFLSEMRYDPVDRSPGTDRLIYSAGHYSIGLWAALAEAGHLGGYDLASYGADGAPLIMSTHEGHPPLVELTGGSLGHGLGVAAGLATGYQMKGYPARIFNFMSDGEVQEGSTWESAMFAAARGLDNLVNVIDVNRVQADGDLVLEIEPHAEKWRAFGWWADEVDGNDIAELLRAFDRARASTGQPKAVICRTALGFGVPLIMERERNHFVRVGDDEWDAVAKQLEVSA
jgi:transketolase